MYLYMYKYMYIYIYVYTHRKIRIFLQILRGEALLLLYQQSIIFTASANNYFLY